jgi:peptidoglycan/xylan/chitin deacetylase (PgdA/CDA1 family)
MPATIARQVIIKADDFPPRDWNAGFNGWRAFLQLIESRGLCASVGIVGQALEKAEEAWVVETRALAGRGRIEFWNHGYSHAIDRDDGRGGRYWEFQGPPLEIQRRHLEQTQQLAKERLGLTLAAFGAPGNHIDEKTVTALESFPEIKIWFFGKPIASRLNLGWDMYVDIEVPTGRPDFEAFRERLARAPRSIVVQVHPAAWTPSGLDQARLAIDHLVAEGAEFLTPTGYYLRHEEAARQGAT